MLRRLLLAAALVTVAASAWAQFPDSLDPFRKGVVVDPLKVGLVAYWRLEEASGTRVDATGRGNDLTDNNTVTNTTGKLGNGAFFVRANSEHLSRADNADLSIGAATSFTVSLWVRFSVASLTSFQSLVTKYADASASNREFLIYAVGGSSFKMIVRGGASEQTITDSIGYVENTWYHIIAGYDHVAQQAFIAHNAGTLTTLSHTAGINDGAAIFEIGVYSAAGSTYLDGTLDEVGLWKRVLTSAERTQLYNSGNGYTLYSVLRWWWMDGRRVA